MRAITCLAVFLFCFAPPLQAQFFKKLGKAAERAFERTTEKKVEKKTTEATEAAFDSLFVARQGHGRGAAMPRLSKVAPAASYRFKRRALMQIESGKEVMDVVYYLPDAANYLCAEITTKQGRNSGTYLTVFDIDRETMFAYMESEGQKTRMGVTFKTEDATDDGASEPTLRITATGNTKDILGYKCQEYKMTDVDQAATIWVTKEVDIRFPSSFHSIEQQQNANQEWMKALDGWVMEMVMTDTSKRKPQTVTMHCLEIGETDLQINSSDYSNFSY